MPALLTGKATGLTKCVAKLKRLQTSLPRRVNQAVTGGAARQELMRLGREGLSTEVYSYVPETPGYKRTFDLLDSVIVVKDADNQATVTLDAAKSPAELPPHDVSYGYFFIAAHESFLNYFPKRDFQSHWFHDATIFARNNVRKAVKEELAR